jgi:arabinogalactan endo-1,4-beta-galactosidase
VGQFYWPNVGQNRWPLTIGISYYYNWHGYSIQETADVVAQAKAEFQKDVMIVEVSHPWTTDGADSANNIINESAPGYPAPSPEVQRDYLIDVSNAVAEAGGLGVIYWEPAWVTSDAYTQWGHGSHWENQAFFDFNGDLLLPGGIEFLTKDYPTSSSTVTFKVDMAGIDTSNGVYATGHFSGSSDWTIIPMALESGSVFSYTTKIRSGSEGAYYFLNNNDWNSRETVPDACAPWWGTDRGYVIPAGTAEFAFVWSSCEPISN